MSDPRKTKKEREVTQVRAFLEAITMPFLEVLSVDADPPDVRVSREGLPALDFEVSEYHSSPDRVAMEKRASELREILNALLEQKPALNGVSLRLLVEDAKMPRRHEQASLAQQLIQCVETILSRDWASAGPYEVVFMPYLRPGAHDGDGRGSLEVSAHEWPIVAQHIRQIDLSRWNFDFQLPVTIYQAQFAICSPRDEAFRYLLEEKMECVSTAMRNGRYVGGNSPLWLLIPVNLSNDLSSFIFNDHGLKASIDSCGFDLASSPVNEVWLLDFASRNKAQRVHPWDDRIYCSGAQI
jgi:hypothetical protein